MDLMLGPNNTNADKFSGQGNTIVSGVYDPGILQGCQNSGRKKVNFQEPTS